MNILLRPVLNSDACFLVYHWSQVVHSPAGLVVALKGITMRKVSFISNSNSAAALFVTIVVATERALDIVKIQTVQAN